MTSSPSEARVAELVALISALEAERAELQALIYARKRRERLQQLLDSDDLSGISVYRHGVPLL